MSGCLQCFCCCFFPNQQPQPTRRPARNQTKIEIQKLKPKPSRLITKFKQQDIVVLSKQEKRMGSLAYSCPICTVLFSKILACDECQNNICRKCFQQYQNKYLISTDNMKCPFCFSQKSCFIDYQKEAHSYFDTTNNGFLSASQRKKIDGQLLNQSDTNSPKKIQSKIFNQNKLDDIKQEENQNGNFQSLDVLIDNPKIQAKSQNKQSIILQNQLKQEINNRQILVESKQEVQKNGDHAFKSVN